MTASRVASLASVFVVGAAIVTAAIALALGPSEATSDKAFVQNLEGRQQPAQTSPTRESHSAAGQPPARGATTTSTAVGKPLLEAATNPPVTPVASGTSTTPTTTSPGKENDEPEGTTTTALSEGYGKQDDFVERPFVIRRSPETEHLFDEGDTESDGILVVSVTPERQVALEYTDAEHDEGALARISHRAYGKRLLFVR